MFIQIKNLSKNIKIHLAVNNISFSIEKNKTLGLAWSKWMWKNYIYWNDVRFNKAN